MRVPFIKMHGLGNDFIVLDGRAAPLPAMTERLAAALADRKTGIGCDQLVVLEPSSLADVRMRIFNADGGEVEACGNATRAVGLLLGKPASIETLGGMLATTPLDAGIAVDMGEPRFDWAAIPLAYALDTLTMPLGWDELENPSAVMGASSPSVGKNSSDANKSAFASPTTRQTIADDVITSRATWLFKTERAFPPTKGPRSFRRVAQVVQNPFFSAAWVSSPDCRKGTFRRS